MKRTHLIAGLLVAAVLVAGVALAGLQYVTTSGLDKGNTIWVTDMPTPASLWGRDNNADAYPLKWPQVFADTPQIITLTTTNYATGYWTIDASSDIAMIALTAAEGAHRKEQWIMKDVQWGMDDNGDIYPLP